MGGGQGVYIQPACHLAARVEVDVCARPAAAQTFVVKVGMI
jgi:hypothetical protein